MVNKVSLKNFATFSALEWDDMARLNVVVGLNDTGKSHLLKLLYGAVRSVQEYDKQRDRAAWNDVLADKLRETFQPPDLELGRLVKKGTSRLHVDLRIAEETVYFAYGPSTRKQINDTPTPHVADDVRALFFPPKEVLTALDAIAYTRDEGKMSGFDDTYLDLVRALRRPTTSGRVRSGLDDVIDGLEALFDTGEIRQEGDEFVFKRGNEKYGMTQTAEGIKKIGLLTHLIRNRTINRGSVLFFDEPETNLHPRASQRLVEMLYAMSGAGVQVFVATHDYFVVKAFELVARAHEERVTFCSLTREDGEVRASFADLRDGMPSNPILDVSMDLLQRDQEIAMTGK
jgi:energy-coupling factor transporter ATP-binding protein EcfA2